MENSEGKAGSPEGRIAERGVAPAEAALEPTRLIARLCGGAQVLSVPGFNNSLDIGERNVLAAEAALQAAGLRVRARATGGHIGRTAKLYIANGQVTARSLGKTEQALM